MQIPMNITTTIIVIKTREHLNVIIRRNTKIDAQFDSYKTRGFPINNLI